MTTVNITKNFCDDLKSTSRSKRQSYSDIKTSGFYVRATPTNRVVFYACGRLSGSPIRIDRKIGVYGVITVAEARKMGRHYLALMENGVDPHEKRRDEQKKLTLRAVAKEFLGSHVATKVKPRTAVEYRRHVEKEILPRLGNMKCADVELKHLRKLHNGLAIHPAKANRVIATFSVLLNWAEGEGYRVVNSNPCKLVKKYPEYKRTRKLSTEELQRLNKELNVYQIYNPYVVGIIRLLLLTGARRDEIRTLKWEEVNFDQKQLELHDSKTGKKALQLNDAGLAIIRSMPRQLNNEYVFCGFKPGRPVVNIRKPWLKIIGLAQVKNATLHDMRRTYASLLLENGFHIAIIAGLLGHKSTKTTERYLEVSSVSLRKASVAIEKLVL